MVFSAQMPSSLLKRSDLTCLSSNTASITRSASATALKSVVASIRAKISSTFSGVNILELRFLMGILSPIYRTIQNMIIFITDILEGDGGVIWSIMFLIIIITVISSGAYI